MKFLWIGIVLLICNPDATAQISLRPGMHAAYVHLLPLPPVLSFGMGLEYDIFAAAEGKYRHERDGMGVHFGYESGVSLLAPMKNKTEMWFTDIDLLLYYRVGSIWLTVSPMAGWSSRNVDKWKHTHSSGRLKYGVAVNASVFRNRLGIDIKLVLMFTSFGRAYTDVELGPASLGIAVAVYEW